MNTSTGRIDVSVVTKQSDVAVLGHHKGVVVITNVIGL